MLMIKCSDDREGGREGGRERDIERGGGHTPLLAVSGTVITWRERRELRRD